MDRCLEFHTWRTSRNDASLVRSYTITATSSNVRFVEYTAGGSLPYLRVIVQMLDNRPESLVAATRPYIQRYEFSADQKQESAGQARPRNALPSPTPGTASP